MLAIKLLMILAIIVWAVMSFREYKDGWPKDESIPLAILWGFGWAILTVIMGICLMAAIGIILS
jgi:small-conductance mechanosensitive channel